MEYTWASITEQIIISDLLFPAIGHAIFVELYAGEFDYQVGSLENQWSAGITAVGNVRDWIDVG